MAYNEFPGGAWPVMLTPFTADNKVDYEGLKALTSWYIDNGCSGLFSDCQSSEMFFLNLQERVNIARTVIETAAGRVPVIVSGHISDTLEGQVEELQQIAALKPDALIFITNRFAKENESDEVWRKNCEYVMSKLPDDIPLGAYECPYPYKRLISLENLKWCADTGRFHFLKDTCCDLELLKQRANAVRNTKLKIYNANTTTLLESIRGGCAGFCGVMASFQMKLYAWLCDHIDDPKADKLQDLLTVTSLIERQYYPVNAKYYLQHYEKLPITTYTRTKDASGLTETFKDEVRQLKNLTELVSEKLGI
ncbi:MAG: dihydrodipicolinate synthase family protein [Succinivibrio sp.]|nr:dihydrodipicolinate synthase family protein [Succinivibrio sp.]